MLKFEFCIIFLCHDLLLFFFSNHLKHRNHSQLMGYTKTGSRPEEKPRETGKQRNMNKTTNCGEGDEGEDVKIR